MIYLLVKSFISGVLVMLISEVARRSPSAGALIASLPLVSLLAMIWLRQETKDVERLATHASSTFWLVLPSLPMFLLLPYLLRHQVTFYPALSICIGITLLLYGLTMMVLHHFDIRF